MLNKQQYVMTKLLKHNKVYKIIMNKNAKMLVYVSNIVAQNSDPLKQKSLFFGGVYLVIKTKKKQNYIFMFKKFI